MLEKKNERLYFHYHINDKEYELTFILPTHSSIMKMISLFAAVIRLILITSHHIQADLVQHSRRKYSETLAKRSQLDGPAYSSRFEHNMCQNQSESVNGFGKIDHCPSYMKSGSEDWRIKRRLLAEKKLSWERLQSLKSGRCGVKDGPLFYTLENRW